MIVDILDKNEILLAHTIPTEANFHTVQPNPTPNPTIPIKLSETIMETFLLKLLHFLFCKFHYQF